MKRTSKGRGKELVFSKDLKWMLLWKVVSWEEHSLEPGRLGLNPGSALCSSVALGKLLRLSVPISTPRPPPSNFKIRDNDSTYLTG